MDTREDRAQPQARRWLTCTDYPAEEPFKEKLFALPRVPWELQLNPPFPCGITIADPSRHLWGLSRIKTTVPRKRGGVAWKHRGWNLSNSLDQYFLSHSKTSFFWSVSHPVMHFSVSFTAMGTCDLQPPENEALEGPTGLTEHEKTGGRGQSLQRKANHTERTSGRSWLFFVKPLYYQLYKINLFSSLKCIICVYIHISGNWYSVLLLSYLKLRLLTSIIRKHLFYVFGLLQDGCKIICHDQKNKPNTKT